MVKQGKMPQRYLESLKFIAKTKKDFEELDKDKKKKLTVKEVTANEDARKKAAEITNTLIEYVQRKDFVAMDRRRFVLKAKDKVVEIFFLKEVFVVDKNKVSFIKSDKLMETTVDELNKALTESRKESFNMTPSKLDSLKKIFGEFELSY